MDAQARSRAPDRVGGCRLDRRGVSDRPRRGYCAASMRVRTGRSTNGAAAFAAMWRAIPALRPLGLAARSPVVLAPARTPVSWLPAGAAAPSAPCRALCLRHEACSRSAAARAGERVGLPAPRARAEADRGAPSDRASQQNGGGDARRGSARSRPAIRRASISPPADVHARLSPSARARSLCEWKGEAVYWDVVAGGETLLAAAWSYPRPTQAFAALAGYIAFYAGAVRCLLLSMASGGSRSPAASTGAG